MYRGRRVRIHLGVVAGAVVVVAVVVKVAGCLLGQGML
jgi:hypothetical protein